MTDFFPDAVFDEGEVEIEVKPTRARNSPGTGRGRTSSKTRLANLQKSLSKELVEFSAVGGMMAPTTGLYIAGEADAFTAALVDVCASNPAALKALENVSRVGPGIRCGKFVLGLGTAMGVDAGRIDPESRAAMFLGVTKYWSLLDQHRRPQQNAQSAEPPYGAFTPVA